MAQIQFPARRLAPMRIFTLGGLAPADNAEEFEALRVTENKGATKLREELSLVAQQAILYQGRETAEIACGPSAKS